MNRTRPSASLVLAFLCACGADPSPATPKATSALPAPRPLATRADHRLAPHAYGKRGDVVVSSGDARFTFATSPDGYGKKPLRGALVDADPTDGDTEDPILWLRAGFRDQKGAMHPLVAAPEATLCEGDRGARSEGVLVRGTVDGVTLVTTACPDPAGGLLVVTEATALPPGAELADDLGPGPSPVILPSGGAEWEGTHEAAAIAVAGPRSTLVVTPRGAAAHVTRTFVHIAKEIFPSPVAIGYGAARAVRHVAIVREDPARALARSGVATTRVAFASVDGAPGKVSFLDAEKRPFASLDVPPEGITVALPERFADAAVLSDWKGVPCARGPLGSKELAKAVCPKNARLGITVHADGHIPAPFHLLVHGEDGTPDPTLADLVEGSQKLRSVSVKNSVYSLDGRADVELAPGKYHVVVTRGPGSTLDERHLVLAPGESFDLAPELRRVVPKDAIAADFHLHSVPSPDSTVSLAARLATLASEGIDFAVATDHNRVTDFRPAKDDLVAVPESLFPSLGIGCEITSGGSDLYGHFNAFPLPALPAGTAPEDYTIPYFGIAPRELFSGARKAGASIVQVNHARMPPKIGYFDQVGFVAATGAAGPSFADDFDALEAHNGLWLESPERVREGLTDMIALARRGKMVAATGNSDSHKLHLEEPGYPRTWVLARAEGASVESRVVEAVRARHTVVSAGPYVDAKVDGELPGSLVRAKGDTVMVDVNVVAPAWIPVERVVLLLDGKPIETFAVKTKPKNGERFRLHRAVRIDRDATLAVWVDAETPLPRVLHEKDARAIAFTTPFYVDRDGDGKLVLPR